jgi:DNA-binding NarL/FixJ family response regulator
MRVLIVEDNAAMRRVIRSVIGDMAHVIECSEGAQAAAAYQRHRPDWVLMDIRMGAVNGIQATGEIKALDPQARVVIVTDYEDAELRQAARAAGACDYVLKEDLFEIRRILIGA